MKKIFSEKNLAGFLFALVIVAFSLAHEDSKKRNYNYNSTTHLDITSQPASFINQVSLPANIHSDNK